ncbi:rod-binding protein [uncultured Sphingomonas sp.]|uniref:rod-binding protein n=1 Tax=uncultured Sphingomonas sp. TaxID=158754 RepID=UPI0035CB94C4
MSATPIAGTTGIGSGLSRTSSPESLKKAGQQFEAVFTGMMLKSMRQAKLADPLFDSKALDTFTDMQDAQAAKAMAEHQPLGIGKAMTDFLSHKAAPAQDDLNPPSSEPPS